MNYATPLNSQLDDNILRWQIDVQKKKEKKKVKRQRRAECIMSNCGNRWLKCNDNCPNLMSSFGKMSGSLPDRLQFQRPNDRIYIAFTRIIFFSFLSVQLKRRMRMKRRCGSKGRRRRLLTHTEHTHTHTR